MKDFSDISNDKDLFRSHQWSGNHLNNGIFIISGPEIKKGYQSNETNIVNIAPTLLYALNEPIPSVMDGKVFEDVFEDSYQVFV